MKKIYVDTEYIYEDMFHEKRMPDDADKKQIIQIAAVLFDHKKGEEIAYLNLLVKPIFHKNLPNFFIKLTGITDEMIKKSSIDFPEALKKFVQFCEDYPILTFSNDYNVFLQNFEFHSIKNPFKKPFIKIAPLLKNFGIDSKKYSSGTLYRAVNLNLKGHVHNALHDVRSMSKAMHVLEQKTYL